MKTNHWWIKADYRVQSALGLVMILLIVSGLLCWLLSSIGWENIWMFFSIYFVALMFIPLGLWQVISGIIHAFNGDKLQKTYLLVVFIYFGITFIYLNTSYYIYDFNYFLIPMSIIALTIAVWKYTVVRADYISLAIINVPKTEMEDLLDA
jgi:hypothetical protein